VPITKEFDVFLSDPGASYVTMPMQNVRPGLCRRPGDDHNDPRVVAIPDFGRFIPTPQDYGLATTDPKAWDVC
jgi:hypothetical protein